MNWRNLIGSCGLGLLLFFFMCFCLYSNVYAQGQSTQITLTWDPVTKNEDGSVCTDLRGYRVYMTTDIFAGVGVYTRIADDINTPNFVDVVLAGTETITFTIPSKDTNFVVTAFDESLNESQLSSETVYTHDTLYPAGPNNLKITRISIINL